MPFSRVRLTPIGVSFAAEPYNLPTAGLGSLEIVLGQALADLSVEHVFSPTKIQDTLGDPSVVGGRDMNANDGWYNEGLGADAGPTVTTINSKRAFSFSHGAGVGNAFRLMRPDTHRSWSVVGALEVNSANLALTNADGPRSAVIKVWDSDPTKYNAVQLVDSGDDLLDYWFVVQEGVPYNSEVAASAGRYVYCASFDYVSRGLRLYINSATSPIVSVTVDADKNNSSTGHWCIGGVPGAPFNWEGPAAEAVILHDKLHGTTDLDAARLAAMTALANASYGYNVTLS